MSISKSSAIAAITTTVFGSHQTSTTESPSITDIALYILRYAEYAKVPLPASYTPGFKCYNAGLRSDRLICQFDTKPTFDEAKAIVAGFESMGADPDLSHYREGNGTMNVFERGGWGVTKVNPDSDVSLRCVQYTNASYEYVFFQFGRKK